MTHSDNKKILVTKSFLPPLEEYIGYLKQIWSNRWLTNSGPFALELERKLEEIFNVKHVSFVSNGTIALQLALRALEIKGEVITTPFTFAATTTAIIWERCTPVFVDIDPDTFCIDASKIEAAITNKTRAILAVHVYGYPCNVEKIERIAKKHNLKVIYDAAHAFGVKINGTSILQFGDISTMSLHATKLFHTAEGGLIVTNDDQTAEKIERIKNFGYTNQQDEIAELGINAKNSELHASLGLVNLKYLPKIINSRKDRVELYRKLLSKTGLHTVVYQKNIEYNYSYFPVVFKNESELLKVKKALEKENIFPRRYFFPSLNTLPYVTYSPCPISESIAKRVLCLPLYHDLVIKTVRKIVAIIKNTYKTDRSA
jgi:dTDP-4-amino-4,6-dideoxygalactose transaminase